MKKNFQLTEKSASILLAAVIVARATAYMFSKICLAEMGPFTLLGIRSILACLIMVPFITKLLKKAKKHDIFAGAVLGVLFFITMVAELMGLETTDSSVASILENTAIVMVPIIMAVVSRKLPKKKVLFCCFLALFGVILMSFDGSTLSLSFGEWMMLAAAFFYAVSIICTSKFASESDPMVIGFLQVLIMGLLSCVFAFLVETPTLPSAPNIWLCIAYLAIICTCFGFTLQPLAQSKCSAEKAAVFCALNPLVATIFGVVIMGDSMEIADFVGLILVLASIVIYGKEYT